MENVLRLQGVETLEDFFAFGRVARILQRAVASHPDALYARLPDGVKVTIGEVGSLVDAYVEGMRGQGIDERSRVAVGMVNSLEHLVVILALYEIGSVWVPLNPRLKGIPLTHVLSECHPTHFLGETTGLRDHVQLSLAELGGSATMRPLDPVVGSSYSSVASFVIELPEARIEQPEDLRAIMYTSGTTGPPKGVMVTDRLLLAAAAGCLRATQCEKADVFYLWEPIHHIGGAQMLILPLISDVSLAFGPAFNRKTFWSDVLATGATHIHYLGGVLQMLLKEPVNAAEKAHSVRIGWGAGATEEIWRESERRFGIRLHECYGATETSSVVTVNTTGPAEGIGYPLPWFDVRIDAGTGSVRGELEVRPKVQGLVTPGYWRNQTATEEARNGGWWRTGDLVAIEEDGGALMFLGRTADGIRVRGENLSAWQIESAFDSHPSVGKSAVVGVDSTYGEQELLLFLQAADGSTIDIPEIQEWAKERLPTLYQPRYLKIVESFELTPSRRVRKGLLDHGLQDSVLFRGSDIP